MQSAEVPQSLPSFVPPSIHKDALLSGTSYSHFTDLPCLIYPNRLNGLDSETLQQGTPCVLGIDEAGRGPVIGPMIYGAFYLPAELQQSLLAATHHFDDSKVLSPAIRSHLMEVLCAHNTDLFNSCGWAIRSLSARDIGAGMLRNGGAYNLNAQAMDATIEIIRGVLERGVNLQEIFVDTIGIPSAYQKKLERIFPSIKFRVEKKADSLFPCVSAASVVAKVTRDISCEILFQCRTPTLLESTATIEEPGWGSGYPSDGKCVSWLKSEMNPLFGWGRECRFSWGTLKDVMDNQSGSTISVEWPADGDEGSMKVSSYFMTGDDEVSNLTRRELRSWYGSRVGQATF